MPKWNLKTAPPPALGELSKLLFHQLALDANGNKLNGMTFEQGYATFHFLPEHNRRPRRFS